MPPGQADGMDKDREHTVKKQALHREAAPHTQTIRPESPRPAHLTRRPVEAGVAFTHSGA